MFKKRNHSDYPDCLSYIKQHTKKPFGKKKWILLVIILLFIIVGTINQNQSKRYDWDEIILQSRIPKPKSNSGYIFSNDSAHLSLYVKNTSYDQYKNYLENCLEMGYRQEVFDDRDEFIVFDQDGFKLTMDHSNKSMSIDLEAPLEMTNFQ